MRSILFVLTVSAYLILVSRTQVVEKAKCKNEGEYCQNHWECCSNSCFSYEYKCVKTSQQPNFVSSIYLAPTRDDANYNKTFHSLEELISSLFAPTERPALDVAQQILLANRIGEGDSVDQSSTPKYPECLGVGAKCYRDSECCTQRCHGFLHQCVT